MTKNKTIQRAVKIKKLYFKDGLSMREVAQRLGVSVSTVNKWVHAEIAYGVDITNWEERL